MEEVHELITTVSDDLRDIISNERKLYFNVAGKDDTKAANHIRNIATLSNHYKELYKSDENYFSHLRDREVDLQIATMQEDNKLAIAESDQATRKEISHSELENKAELAEINARFEVEKSKIDNNAKMAIVESENQMRLAISNADLEMRKREYILNAASAGLNVATKMASIGVVTGLSALSLTTDINPNFAGVILGRTHAGKMAERFLTNVISKGI